MKRLGLLILMLLVGMVYSDVSVGSYSVHPEYVRPGGRGTISLTLINQGSNPVEDISVFVYSSTRIHTQTSIFVGDLQIGGQTVVNIPFTVDENTSTGVYTVRLNIKGTEKDYSQNIEDRSVSRSIDIPIYVVHPPLFSMEIPESVAVKSSTNTINLTLVNNGGDSKDVALLPECDGLMFFNSIPIYLGDVNEGKERTVSLRFKIKDNVPPGEYSCPLIVRSYDNIGNLYNQTVLLSFNIKEENSNFMVNTNNEFLKPGESTNLRLTIKNTGDKPVYDVRIKFSDNPVFIPESSELPAANLLEPGEKIEVSSQIGVREIAPGYYSIPVIIKYEDEYGREHEETKTFIQQVSSEGLIKIFLESNEVPMYEGNEYSLSVKVSNTGVSEVKSVILRILNGSVIVLNPQTSQYIGTLDADDFSSVQYEIYIPDDATKGGNQITLSFEVEYLDTFNKPHTEEIDVPITVYPKSMEDKLEPKGNNYWILLVGLLVILGVWWKVRKVKR